MTKRLLSLFLALVTVFSLAAPAYAADGEPTEEAVLTEEFEEISEEAEDISEEPEEIPEEPEGEVVPLAEDIIASGACGAEGDNLTWVLTGDGVLTISGTGDMGDFDLPYKCPWYDYQQSILSVVVESGVTTIGEYAFFQCVSLSRVTIPNTVTTIGERAFQGCTTQNSHGRRAAFPLRKGRLGGSGRGYGLCGRT